MASRSLSFHGQRRRFAIGVLVCLGICIAITMVNCCLRVTSYQAIIERIEPYGSLSVVPRRCIRSIKVACEPIDFGYVSFALPMVAQRVTQDGLVIKILCDPIVVILMPPWIGGSRDHRASHNLRGESNNMDQTLGRTYDSDPYEYDLSVCSAAPLSVLRVCAVSDHMLDANLTMLSMKAILVAGATEVLQFSEGASRALCYIKHNKGGVSARLSIYSSDILGKWTVQAIYVSGGNYVDALECVRCIVADISYAVAVLSSPDGLEHAIRSAVQALAREER